MQLGKTFMLLGLEYKVESINGNHIGAKLLSEGNLPTAPSKILVGNEYYNLIYVNKGQKFITLTKH